MREIEATTGNQMAEDLMVGGGIIITRIRIITPTKRANPTIGARGILS